MSAASDVSGAWVLVTTPQRTGPTPGHPIEPKSFKRSYIMSPKSFRLMQFHQRLDSQLRMELARRWPDFSRIQKLKKLKLSVKDQLQRIVNGIGLRKKRTA
jgi:uncharacterized protein